VPIEQVVYPSVHHSFDYPELQPGRTTFGRWAEYNEEAAADASRRIPGHARHLVAHEQRLFERAALDRFPDRGRQGEEIALWWVGSFWLVVVLASH